MREKDTDLLEEAYNTLLSKESIMNRGYDGFYDE